MEKKSATVSAEEWAKFVEVWAEATRRSWQDPAFKAALEADPRGALQKEYSYDIPADFDVNIAKPGESHKVSLTANLAQDESSLASERIALAAMHPVLLYKTC